MSYCVQEMRLDSVYYKGTDNKKLLSISVKSVKS